jgi:excisionase family DNA binding protein
MPTTITISDALELMSQLHATAQDLLKSLKEFGENLEKQKTSKDRPRLLTMKEAAERLGISYHTLRQYCHTGQTSNRTPMPEFLKIGTKTLFDEDELERWKREDAPHYRRTRPRKEGIS